MRTRSNRTRLQEGTRIQGRDDTMFYPKHGEYPQDDTWFTDWQDDPYYGDLIRDIEKPKEDSPRDRHRNDIQDTPRDRGTEPEDTVNDSPRDQERPREGENGQVALDTEPGGISFGAEVASIGDNGTLGVHIGVDVNPLDFDVTVQPDGDVNVSGGVGLPGGLLGVSGGVTVDSDGNIIGGSVGGSVGGIGVDVAIEECDAMITVSYTAGVVTVGVSYSHDLCAEDEPNGEVPGGFTPPRPAPRPQIPDRFPCDGWWMIQMPSTYGYIRTAQWGVPNSAVDTEIQVDVQLSASDNYPGSVQVGIYNNNGIATRCWVAARRRWGIVTWPTNPLPGAIGETIKEYGATNSGIHTSFRSYYGFFYVQSGQIKDLKSDQPLWPNRCPIPSFLSLVAPDLTPTSYIGPFTIQSRDHFSPVWDFIDSLGFRTQAYNFIWMEDKPGNACVISPPPSPSPSLQNQLIPPMQMNCCDEIKALLLAMYFKLGLNMIDDDTGLAIDNLAINADEDGNSEPVTLFAVLQLQLMILNHLNEAYKGLDLKELNSEGLEIPNRNFIPGGTGYTKAQTYLDILQIASRERDYYGIHGPIKVKIKDTNLLDNRQTPKEEFYPTPTAAITRLLDLALEDKIDRAAQTNILFRLGIITSQIAISANKIYYGVVAVLEGLGIPVRFRPTTVPIPFDPFLGIPPKRGGNKDDNKLQFPDDEEELEKMLPKLLPGESKDQPTSVMEVKKHMGLRQILIKLLEGRK